jgi:hypothetical protein
MNDVYKLETAPVVLHQWQSEDYAEFASMNAAPQRNALFPEFTFS